MALIDRWRFQAVEMVSLTPPKKLISYTLIAPHSINLKINFFIYQLINTHYCIN